MSNPRGRPKRRELIVSPEQKITLQQLLQQLRSLRSLAFRARNHSGVCQWTEQRWRGRQAAHHGLYGGVGSLCCPSASHRKFNGETAYESILLVPLRLE